MEANGRSAMDPSDGTSAPRPTALPSTSAAALGSTIGRVAVIVRHSQDSDWRPQAKMPSFTKKLPVHRVTFACWKTSSAISQIRGSWTRSSRNPRSESRKLDPEFALLRSAAVAIGVSRRIGSRRCGLVDEDIYETSRRGSGVSASVSASSPWAVFSQKDGVAKSCHIAFSAAMDIITQ